MSFGEEAVDIARRAKQEDIPRLRRVTRFYEQSLGLINEIEEQKIRAEELKNRDVVVRGKHSKKIAKTAKRITQLFNTINQSFMKKEIRKEEGVIFSEALRKALNEGISTISRPSCPTCHLQRLKALAGTTSEARQRLSQLNNLVVLYAEYEEARSNLNKKIKETRRGIEKARKHEGEKERLKTIHERVKGSEELVSSYERARQLLDRYNSSRKAYLKELRGVKAVELIRFFLENSLAGYGFPEPDDANSLRALSELLKKDLPGLTAAQVLEYSSFNDKKLSHFTPEPAKLRTLVEKNHQWLSRVSRLESTASLQLELDSDEEQINAFTAFLKERAPELAAQLRELASLKRSLDVEAAKRALDQRREAESLSSGDSEPKDAAALEGELSEYEKIRREWFS